MLQTFLLALLSAGIVFLAVAYYHSDGDGIELSRMPWVVRFLIYPFYLFAFAYGYCLFFALTVWIPDLVEVVVNFIVGIILLWMDAPEWLGYVYEIIGDLVLTPILVLVYMFLVTFWNFGETSYSARTFTFYYRLAVLVPMTCFFLYVTIFRPMDGLSWYDNVVYSGAIAVAAVLSYLQMKEDRNKKSNEELADMILSEFFRH